MFDVNWTGSYPGLCFGEWIIKYKEKTLELPEAIKKNDMGTYGEYESWHFEDGMEIFESYTDGLNEKAWIETNREWIEPLFNRYSIPLTDGVLHEFYTKIQENDFRSGSCGGCI